MAIVSCLSKAVIEVRTEASSMVRDTLYSIQAVSSTKLDFPSASLLFSLKEIVSTKFEIMLVRRQKDASLTIVLSKG